MPKHTFPLSGPIDLQVRIGHGSLTVEAQDDLDTAGVSIEARPHSTDLLAQTAVEMRGSTLAVVAPRQGGIFDALGLSRGNRGLDVRILVPSGTAVKLSTITAPIVVTGRVGDADVAFGSADAGLRHVDGDLRLRFGSGGVKVVRVTGSVQLRSGSGAAEFGEIGGALSSGCGSGDLSVRSVQGRVRSRAGSGSARLGRVHGDVDLASGSGGVEIGLPSGVTAQLDVHTGLGRVHSELPIESEPKNRDGAITLRARTGSGDVRLFRAA